MIFGRKNVGIRVEGVAADVKPEKLFFVGKFFVLAPWPARLPPRRGGCVGLFIEERNLASHPIALESCGGCKRIIDACEELRAIAPCKIECARLNEAFQHLAISHARIEPRTKILKRTEVAASISLANSDCHRCLADVFDRSQAVTKCIQCGCIPSTATVGTLKSLACFWCKFQPTLVYVRRQNGNSHPLAFTYEDRNFFRVVDFVAQQTRHEFHREMRLAIGRVVT